MPRDDQVRLFLTTGMLPKKYPATARLLIRQHAAQRAEQHEQAVAHQAAGHERRKGADNGQEAREDDGFAVLS